MSLIIWNDQLKVGISIIDTQHQELVRMANELADAMKAGHGRDVLEKLLASLTSYTVSHFGTEERLMQQHAYAKAADHKKQHDDLKAQVTALQAKAKEGKLSVTLETMNFLKDWLMKHINHTDKDLAAHLALKGVK